MLDLARRAAKHQEAGGITLLSGVLGARKGGAGRRGSVGALVGGLAGAVVGTLAIPVPLLGSLIGACAGACA